MLGKLSLTGGHVYINRSETDSFRFGSKLVGKHPIPFKKVGQGLLWIRCRSSDGFGRFPASKGPRAELWSR